MKKLLCLFLLLLLTSCAAPVQENETVDVVATLFPQYDFTREIAGDLANVTLLLPPGAESHSYEPTPSDLLALERADLVLYTGGEMEPWAERIVPEETLVNAAERVLLRAHDPHVWTDPQNAVLMAERITDALCAADPTHAAQYRENAAVYLEKLHALDRAFATAVESAARKTVVFGGRNAFSYLTERYGLSVVSAYDSCGHESEPSAGAVAEVIDRVKQDAIPVVYYEELVEPKVARLIAEETGAELLLLHSCHNVTQAELDAGVSYLSLMQQNLEHLTKGLS